VTKREVSFLKIVEDSVRRRFANKSKPVSYESREGRGIWEEVIILFVLMTKDTLKDSFTDRDALSWCELFCTLGEFDLFLSDLKVLDKVILHSLHKTDDEILRIYRENLHQCCHCTRAALGRIKWLIELVARLDRTSVANWHQICAFGERVTVPDFPKAEENAVNKWKKAYAYTSSILTEATFDMKCSVAEAFFKYKPWLLFSPTHSNGSVIEHYPKVGKRGISWKRLTRYQKFLVTNGRLTRYCLRKAGLPALPTPLIKEPPRKYTFQMYVPKGVDSRRIVEPESAERVFCQHGVAAALNTVLDNEYGAFYHRHDSSVNGQAALLASKTGDYDTIDITSASDSNRWMLIKSLFELCDPTWVYMLHITRSTISVLPDGSYFPKVCVGSMGNPYTFPSETLVFVELLKEAARRMGRKLRKFYVYGDDIVCPHWLTEVFLEVLREFGFIPNMDKTFTGEELFRESCGTDAFLGIDITPERISRFWKPLTRSPQVVAANADMANRCFKRLPLVRRYILDSFTKLGIKLPFSDDRTGLVLQSQGSSNTQLRRVIDGFPDWQYDSVKIHALVQQKEKYAGYPDDLLYWEWLQSAESRDKDFIPEPTREQQIVLDSELLQNSDFWSRFGLRYEWVPDAYT
jgi:hypothetical protein